MSIMIKQLVKHKLKTLTTSEIMGYAKEYDFSINQMEAEQIIYYLRNTNFDPFNERDRRVFFQQLGEITDQGTAQKAYQLFHHLIESYNLTYLFDE